MRMIGQRSSQCDPPPQQSRASVRRGLRSGLLLALILATGGAAQTTAPGDALGLELTPAVRQQLQLLQQTWQVWVNAYFRGDQKKAEAAVEELVEIAEFLGLPRLPDLSIAAASSAVLAATEGGADAGGDKNRALWALAAAEQLDPGRPETEFARATVLRASGNYFGALLSSCKGTWRLLNLPFERNFAAHNLVYWALCTLVVSGGLFVALSLWAQGTRLLEDLNRRLPTGLRGSTRTLALALVLVWPIVLPGGLLWLILYGSILIWGYGTKSERGVLISWWLLLGAMPLVLAQQQRQLQLDLAPPTRGIAGIVNGRLYGALFTDLSVLGSLLPNNPAVLELTADLHRKFNQWDHARLIYNDLATDQQRERAAAALNNIGVYHHRNGDYATAITYFRSATEADPRLPEAFFNLSQAFSQSYDFPNSNNALARAKELGSRQVDGWLKSKGQEDPASSVIAIEGGLARRNQISEQLAAGWSGSDRSALRDWRFYLTPGAAVFALVLAVLWHQLRNRGRETFPAPPGSAVTSRFSALVPGLVSLRQGRGLRAFAAIFLPVGLLLVPILLSRGYRVPLGYSGSFNGLVGGFSILVLLGLIGWRFSRALAKR